MLLDAATWTGLSVVIGFAASRVPDAAFAHDTWLTRTRPAERGGRAWERVGIRRWKHVLPEAGGLFGGTSKKRLSGRGAVARQLVETRRAEWVHWALLCCGPLFALWNPPWLAAVMVVVGLALSLPFIAVLRFNRARLLRVSARSVRLGTTTGGTLG